MILLALLAFYGGLFLGCVALLLHAVFAPNKTHQETPINPDRVHSAALSGLLLVVSFAGVWVLAKTVGAAHILVSPFVVLATLLYVVGYLAPASIRVPIETRIRHYMDYLEFTLPAALLPMADAFRKVLVYLGLAVD